MRKRTALSLGLTLSLMILSIDVGAATRTVQFAGSTINYATKLKIDQFQNQTICSVVIANTGSTSQQVTDLRFYVHDSATSKTVVQATPSAGVIYNGGTGTSCGISSASTCLSTEITAGGVYVGVAFVEPAAMGGALLTVCSGQFTVVDHDAARPGSVVASGAVGYVAEQGITGGQFQGALYFSGSRVPSTNAANAALMKAATDNIWTNSSIPTENLTTSLGASGWLATNQMNLFCAQACKKNAVAPEADWCETICGTQTNPPSFHSGKRVIGYLEANNASANLTHLIKTADPQWAGGHVMEMIIGPFDSICSGNKAYFDNGNTDFSHVDTIDSDGGLVMASAVFPGKGPPERLYCAHTHIQDSPYGYVNPSVQFPINGGMPF